MPAVDKTAGARVIRGIVHRIMLGKNTQLCLIALYVLSQTCVAEQGPDPCPVEFYFSAYGYDVELVGTEVQSFSNLDGFESTLLTYMSPDNIDKYDYAVIAYEVSLCVQEISDKNICVSLHDENNPEGDFFKVCNWGVADQEPYRISVNYSTSHLPK